VAGDAVPESIMNARRARRHAGPASVCDHARETLVIRLDDACDRRAGLVITAKKAVDRLCAGDRLAVASARCDRRLAERVIARSWRVVALHERAGYLGPRLRKPMVGLARQTRRWIPLQDTERETGRYPFSFTGSGGEYFRI